MPTQAEIAAELLALKAQVDRNRQEVQDRLNTSPPSGFVEPSNYPLELVSPRAAGTVPSADSGTPNFPVGHRIFKAYPGLEYSIRAVVIGGSFPYRYSLTNAPSGMTINDAGEITWANPASTATPTITVTDAEGTERSASWTITVTTSGFKFVSPSGNDSAAGTLAAPWQTFSKVKSSSASGDIVYFRSGTYTTNLPPDSLGGKSGEFVPVGNWARIEIGASTRSVQWLAYPGEVPIFDGGYVPGVTQGPLVRMIGSATIPLYLDGLEFRNYYHIAIQQAVPGHYHVFRNLDMHDVGQSIDGGNSACIMTLTNLGNSRYYTAVQDCNFHDNMPAGMKAYDQRKMLWEDCLFVDNGGHSQPVGHRFAGGPDHKDACPRFEVRTCTFRNLPSTTDVPDNNGATNDSGVGGAMDAGSGSTRCSGEFRYNKFGGSSRPGLRIVTVNNRGNCDEIYVYRNTGIGRWNADRSDEGGPFTFYRNVIINDILTTNDRISVTTGNRAAINTQDNLTGGTADGIVDSNLDLQGSYLTDFGPNTTTPRGAQWLT